MKNLSIEKVIYKKGETNLQTSVYKDEKGIERCAYSGYLRGKEKDLTVEEYLREPESAGHKCLLFDDALEQIREAEERVFLTGWQEITREKWVDMLEVLPPRKWKTVNGVEIFQMSEMTAGNITAHYARLGNRYFTANKRLSDSYEDISNEIRAI